MLLETEKERVCINQIIGQKIQEFEIEGDVIVNDIKPDVLNVISTDGIPCIYKKEIINGKIKLEGNVNTYIIYLADDEKGSIRSLNTAIDFSKIVDMPECLEGMNVNEKITIKSINCNVLNGRKLNIKIILMAEITAYANNNIEIISEIKNLNDVQIASNNKAINSLIGSGTTKTYAKDTISIPIEDEVAEIMKANVRIINKETKTSYNKILAKSDLEISIVYLTEDNRIKNTNAKIPVMGFVDIENISDDNICDTNYKIKNLIIKPNNGDMNSIYIDAEIEISCYAYERREINLIEDLYSISSNLSFTPCEIVAMSDKRNINEVCNIKEQISMPEIANNQLYNANTKINIININIKNNKVIYEGEANIELLYGINNSAEEKVIIIPFNFEINNDGIDENCMIDLDTNIVRDDFIVNSDGNININVDIEFNLNISKNEKMKIINEINVEENRDSNIYSMVIYFVKPGDTLWKIAKKFRSTVEDIARVNGIEDADKIHVGQQLYIPKYVRKSIAV